LLPHVFLADLLNCILFVCETVELLHKSMGEFSLL
jgi:hypothetical protein